MFTLDKFNSKLLMHVPIICVKMIQGHASSTGSPSYCYSNYRSGVLSFQTYGISIRWGSDTVILLWSTCVLVPNKPSSHWLYVVCLDPIIGLWRFTSPCSLSSLYIYWGYCCYRCRLFVFQVAFICLFIGLFHLLIAH